MTAPTVKQRVLEATTWRVVPEVGDENLGEIARTGVRDRSTTRTLPSP